MLYCLYEFRFCVCVVVHAYVIGIWGPFLVGSRGYDKILCFKQLEGGFYLA